MGLLLLANQRWEFNCCGPIRGEMSIPVDQSEIWGQLWLDCLSMLDKEVHLGDRAFIQSIQLYLALNPSAENLQNHVIYELNFILDFIWGRGEWWDSYPPTLNSDWCPGALCLPYCKCPCVLSVAGAPINNAPLSSVWQDRLRWKVPACRLFPCSLLLKGFHM